LAVVFAAGACLGSLVNWAIYALAWCPRTISPWSPAPPNVRPRRWADRVPILGWFGLRRESPVHGRLHWLRPVAMEICLGAALAALYWWEIERLGLIQGQVGRLAIAAPMAALHWQFACHALLLCWMLAASFIDIDEKIIPDEITVTGTLLGMLLAIAAPLPLLPNVEARPAATVVSRPLELAGDGQAAGGQAAGQNRESLWLEPVTAIAPAAWPDRWAERTSWRAALVALACYLLWCFALAPRIWRGRRGPVVALRLIAARMWREYGRAPLAGLVNVGVPAICGLWLISNEAGRAGLVTALVGLVGGGGIVWAVRLIGTAALRREAMGFGDVTLMMMIGTFLGWQACLVAFFIAPFAGLFAGLAQLVFRRDDVIPYGPFLCLAAAATVVGWAAIWSWAEPLFAVGPLVPLVLVVCLGLLGVLLVLWRLAKTWLWGRDG
jgi:prepilin signal peptidase PulO-like enzyme (type II secretory pathway)